VRRVSELLIVGVSVLGMVGASAAAAGADTGPWRGPSTAIAPPLPEYPDGESNGLQTWSNPKVLTWRGGAALVAAHARGMGDYSTVWGTARTSGPGRFVAPARPWDWLSVRWVARPDGSALAVGPSWCSDASECSLEGRVWRPFTSWGRADPLADSATSWAVGSRPDGTATVAWADYFQDTDRIRSRLRVATLTPQARSWSKPKTLARDTEATVLGLDVAADGSSAMLTQQYTGRPCEPTKGDARVIHNVQVRTRSPKSSSWSAPVTVLPSACLGYQERAQVALAAGPRGKVTIVNATGRGTYFRTRPRTGRPFTARRKVGAGATDVALRSGADGVITLAYSAKKVGLITRTQLPHRTTWGQRRRLAAPKDKVVSVDLSTGGRDGAVLGWREALSSTREEVHVRTKGSSTGPWTKDRTLGTAPRSYGDGWVHRGTGRSSIATWFDLNDTVKVSSFG
jgi:hypothetical protein